MSMSSDVLMERASAFDGNAMELLIAQMALMNVIVQVETTHLLFILG